MRRKKPHKVRPLEKLAAKLSFAIIVCVLIVERKGKCVRITSEVPLSVNMGKTAMPESDLSAT